MKLTCLVSFGGKMSARTGEVFTCDDEKFAKSLIKGGLAEEFNDSSADAPSSSDPTPPQAPSDPKDDQSSESTESGDQTDGEDQGDALDPKTDTETEVEQDVEVTTLPPAPVAPKEVKSNNTKKGKK